MKRIIIILLILFPLITFAEEKIGYVDTDRVINSYKGLSPLKSQINMQINQWKRELGAKKLEIKRLKEDLNNKELVISNEMKLEKENEIKRKEREYAQFIDSIWGEGGLLEKKKKEYSRIITVKIDTIIKRIAQEEGYTIIFDKSKSGIIYSKDVIDITNDVIDALNGEFGSQGTAKTLEIAIPGIFETNNKAQEIQLGSRVRAILKNALNRIGDYEFTKIQDISNSLNGMGITVKRKLTDTELATLGRNLGVDYVIYGTCEADVGVIKTNFKLINAKTGLVVVTSERSVDSDKKLDQLVNDILTDIKPKMR
ncbi:OmpH family outer membrane protein [candidate division WOR-3 bacterium]|nr:OmpH family outer membrane protein [candidate division WOR-3 bacterium]